MKITHVIAVFVMVIVFAVSAAMTTFAATETEDLWVYPEEVVTEIAKKIGYTPAYELEKWFDNHWELAIELEHIQFTYRIDRHDEAYEGWRMKRADFENLMVEEMKKYFVKGVEPKDVYTDYEIEKLFESHYGYDVECEFDVYHDESQVNADLVIRDYYNGKKYWLKAVLTTEGWMIPRQSWENFTERRLLQEESEYAENVWWLDIGDLKEEFRDKLGYTPKFALVEGEGEGDFYIEITFDHLGGETYLLDYVYENEGELLISDRVLEKFWDENPETSVVLDLDFNQLWNLLWFYMLMI